MLRSTTVRELYIVAGKIKGALMSLAGRVVAETKREYSMSGATIVYRGTHHTAVGKDAEVLSKKATTATGQPAAWRRLGSWSTRTEEWSFDDVEFTRLGITQAELEERAKAL